jgi:hypothetical protein
VARVLLVLILRPGVVVAAHAHKVAMVVLVVAGDQQALTACWALIHSIKTLVLAVQQAMQSRVIATLLGLLPERGLAQSLNGALR